MASADGEGVVITGSARGQAGDNVDCGLVLLFERDVRWCLTGFQATGAGQMQRSICLAARKYAEICEGQFDLAMNIGGHAIPETDWLNTGKVKRASLTDFGLEQLGDIIEQGHGTTFTL